MNQSIEAALQLASDTQHLLIGENVIDQIDTVFQRAFGDTAAVLVTDQRLYDLFGAQIEQQLRQSQRTIHPSIILPGDPPPYADFETVLAVQAQLEPLNAHAIVVGSGTLNDVTKLASYRLGRQYMCVGTAASMDGYTAFGAAITKDGFKQTMSCPAPRAVVADLQIVANAPKQMHATGYGDLLGKITAGADWILADALQSEPIDQRAWPLVQQQLRSWLADPQAVQNSQPQAIGHLFEGLIMAGIAMQISSSSRPASGSEHRFSHLWEMEALAEGHPAVPHGFKVGVGSIASAALYELVLAYDFSTIDIEARCAAWPSRDQIAQEVRDMHRFEIIAENAVSETLAKYITPDQLRERLTLLKQQWPSLQPKLAAQMLPAAELARMLAAVGCPTLPEEIGLTREHVRESYALARTIRARYTILDLIHETGIIDQCLDQLFGPGGYWSR